MVKEIVDIDRIIRQAKEIEEQKKTLKTFSLETLAQETNSKSEPRQTLWKRLFNKKKSNKILPKKIINSTQEIKDIQTLRRELGTEDLHRKESRKNMTFDDVEIDIQETPITEKKSLEAEQSKKIRSQLGLSKERFNARSLYEQLEHEANKNVENEEAQYEQEQAEIHKHEQEKKLFHSQAQIPITKPIQPDWEREDETLIKDFPKTEEKVLETDHFIIGKDNEDLKEVTSIKDDFKPHKNKHHEVKRKLEEQGIPIPEPQKTPSLLEDKYPQDFEEKIPYRYQGEKLLENHYQEQEKKIEKTLDEELEETTHVLEELEAGKEPVEDIALHLEQGMLECQKLLELRQFMEAKYTYNDLCTHFREASFTEEEKTKWFGVLKKMYERIIEAEKI